MIKKYTIKNVGTDRIYVGDPKIAVRTLKPGEHCVAQYDDGNSDLPIAFIADTDVFPEPETLAVYVDTSADIRQSIEFALREQEAAQKNQESAPNE